MCRLHRPDQPRRGQGHGEEVRAAWLKELPAALTRAADGHPGQRIALYFQDEARWGQKGRCCRLWWLRGQRPTGPVDQRCTSACVFAAVEPATGRDFCLVSPAVSTAAMSEFLRRFAASFPDDEHAVMILDGAGWHTSLDLAVPSERDAAAPAALFAGAEPCRTGLAAPARAPSVAQGA